MPDFKKIKIGTLFDIHPTKSYGLTNDKLFEIHGKVPVVVNSSRDNGIGGFVNLKPKEKGGIITFSDTTTSDSIFYQPNDFIGYSHIQGVYPLHSEKWTRESLLYFIATFRKVSSGQFDYASKFNRKIAHELEVYLPVKDNITEETPVIEQLDFSYMEKCIRELEAARIRELEAYLKVAGLEDYMLTPEDFYFMETKETRRNSIFNLENLFGKSTRGKRLKGDDRIHGDLPFVTAGETDTGISAYIGNDVDIFKPNTITIDMFGSAKYRNYRYGADDHVAVVHTENIDKNAVIYITAAIHKVSYNSFWDYSNNFYAKDADALNISLPDDGNGNPDYEYMSRYIHIQHKLVIKNVVEWKDHELAAYRTVAAN